MTRTAIFPLFLYKMDIVALFATKAPLLVGAPVVKAHCLLMTVATGRLGQFVRVGQRGHRRVTIDTTHETVRKPLKRIVAFEAFFVLYRRPSDAGQGEREQQEGTDKQNGACFPSAHVFLLRK